MSEEPIVPYIGIDYAKGHHPADNPHYRLFAGHRHYPQGGWNDFQGDFFSVDEAKAYFIHNKRGIARGSYVDNWGHVVDTHTNRVAARWGLDESPSSRTGGFYEEENDHE